METYATFEYRYEQIQGLSGSPRSRAYCTLQNLEIFAFFREESPPQTLHTRPEGKN